MAAKNGNDNTIEVLVNRGSDINLRSEIKGRSPLHIASKYDRISTVRLLIGLGALVNLGDRFAMTSLMHAAKGGNLEVVKLLLQKGAAINNLDKNGWTAVHFAAKFGHVAILETLIGHGAAFALQENVEGKTPLMVRIAHTVLYSCTSFLHSLCCSLFFIIIYFIYWYFSKLFIFYSAGSSVW